MCTTKRGINQERERHEFQERNDSTQESNEGNSQGDSIGMFQDRTWQQTHKATHKEEGDSKFQEDLQRGIMKLIIICCV